MRLKILLSFLMLIVLQSARTSAAERRISNREFDVVVREDDLRNLPAKSPFQFEVKNKIKGTAKVFNLEGATKITNLAISGSYLSVFDLNIGADNSEYWFHLIDLGKLSEVKNDIGKNGMSDLSLSPNKKFFIFSDYADRRRSCTDTDSINVVELKADGPVAQNFGEKIDGASFWLLKSNFLWANDEKAVYFIVRTGPIAGFENLNEALSLYRIGLSNGIEKYEFHEMPINLRKLISEKANPTQFLFDNALPILNDYPTFEISWKDQRTITMRFWHAGEHKMADPVELYIQ